MHHLPGLQQRPRITRPAPEQYDSGRSDSTASGVTEFTITDGAECDTVRAGKYHLSGTLKFQFAGRILPHENTKVVLYGDGVSSISGKFDRVEVPDGWLYDLEYDYDKPAVVIKNFRPDRAPAFPGAEGFGKYADRRTRRQVIAVTNLNDAGPGSFRAACMAEGAADRRVSCFRHDFARVANQDREPLYHDRRPNGARRRHLHPQPRSQIQHARCHHSLYAFSTGRRIGIEYDGFSGQGDQVIIDHCSVSWGIDETFSINKASNLYRAMVHGDRESVQLDPQKRTSTATADCGAGRAGRGITTFLPITPAAIRARPGTRNPGLMDFRNNVIYNWGFNSAYGGELWPRNWINNYYKSGPATERKVRHRIFIQADARGPHVCGRQLRLGLP